MLNIKIIIGSTRPGRFSEKVAGWVRDLVVAKEGHQFEFLDLRDYPLPFYDQQITPSQIKDGQYPNEIAKQWAEKIKDADAFIVITPEYNRGPSAVLKNALDSVYAEWNNKPVGFISYGAVGGTRAVEQLRLNSVELQMAPIRSAVHLQQFWTVLDEQGNTKPGAFDAYNQQFENMLTQLTWWGEALKTARE